MSYIVTSQTPPFSPVYNEMTFIAKDTTNYSKNQYKYICWIYDGSGSNLLATIKLYPDANAQGFFDIHRILENFVTSDFFVNEITLPNFEARVNSYVSYVTKFGYEYGIQGSSSFPYSSGVSVTSSKQYAWNGIFDYEDFIFENNAQFDDWKLVSSQQNKFLTNSPRSINIRPGTNFWLSCMTDWGTTALVDHLCLKTYGFNGALIATYRDYTNSINPAIDNGKFLQVPAGTIQLGGTGRLPNTVNYYTLTLEDSSNNPVSETFTININYDCSRWIWYRLHFMNKLGGFDSFDFRQKSHQNRQTTTQTYRRLSGLAGAYNDGISLQTTQRELAQFDTIVKPTLNVESDWITDAQSTWLEELLTSPQVFIENSNSTFTPVVILTSSFEVQQRKNDTPINLKLELQYHYNKYRQRG